MRRSAPKHKLEFPRNLRIPNIFSGKCAWLIMGEMSMPPFMSLARSALVFPALLLIGPPIAEAQQLPALVRMTDDMKFDPQTITVTQGQSIEWQNTSKVVHTVTADRKLTNKCCQCCAAPWRPNVSLR